MLPSLASHLGFRPVYGVLGLLCGASALLTWHWLHEPPEAAAEPRRPPRGAGIISPLRDPMIWRIVCGIGILCAPQFAVLTFATVFLHDAAHVGIAGITATMVAVQLGAMIMRVWSGRFTDRHGNRAAYLRGSILVAVASFVALTLAVASGAPGWSLMPIIAFAGICVSAWHGVAYTELATLAGKDRAQRDRELIELYAELDQMKDEELGYWDPRPWHRDRPQRPARPFATDPDCRQPAMVAASARRNRRRDCGCPHC